MPQQRRKWYQLPPYNKRPGRNNYPAFSVQAAFRPPFQAIPSPVPIMQPAAEAAYISATTALHVGLHVPVAAPSV